MAQASIRRSTKASCVRPVPISHLHLRHSTLSASVPTKAKPRLSQGSRGGCVQMGFEFRENLFDRVQVAAGAGSRHRVSGRSRRRRGSYQPTDYPGSRCRAAGASRRAGFLKADRSIAPWMIQGAVSSPQCRAAMKVCAPHLPNGACAFRRLPQRARPR
jgi:hypothetical protein